MTWRHFSEDEVRGLRRELVDRLDAARTIAHIPFVVTSGFRTPEQNTAVGGGDNSAHLRGWAVDLRARSSSERYAIVRALLAVGFRRIVLYTDKACVHVDCDPSLSQDVMVLK